MWSFKMQYLFFSFFCKCRYNHSYHAHFETSFVQMTFQTNWKCTEIYCFMHFYAHEIKSKFMYNHDSELNHNQSHSTIMSKHIFKIEAIQAFICPHSMDNMICNCTSVNTLFCAYVKMTSTMCYLVVKTSCSNICQNTSRYIWANSAPKRKIGQPHVLNQNIKYTWSPCRKSIYIPNTLLMSRN